MSDLKLERPLVFFDLETTGVNVARDRIVEISVVKLLPDGTRTTRTRRLNPEMPIPAEAAAVHGIHDADVANEPTFRDVSRNLYLYLEGCDLGGYNILKFDIPLLVNEFKRTGLDFSMEGRRCVDAFSIFCKLFPRTLVGAYKFFCGKELDDAHSAEADTLATLDVFMQQLAKYPELPRDLDELHEYCDNRDPDALDSTGKFKWSGDKLIINFGKNSGTALKDIAVDNPGFLQWIIKADFPDDAKQIASDALKGQFPEKTA